MTDSLREQLLKLGFKKPEPPARPAQVHKPKSNAPQQGRGPQRPAAAAAQRVDPRPSSPPRRAPAAPQVPRPPRSQEEIDLARAYALRERQERDERETARREAEAKARARRERRQQLQALVQGKSVNDAEAELMRHFPHREKIRRVHVTAAQLAALNNGELGVVQIEGRYLLVDRDTAVAVRAVFEDALVLLPDPGSSEDDDLAAAYAAAMPGA